MIFPIAICISLAIMNYFEFDWIMRYSKYNFKRYSLKAQRIVLSCLACIAIIPIVILKIVDPATDDMYYYNAVAGNAIILILYNVIISGVSRQAIKKEETKKKIIELGLSDNNDLQYIKNELKSWYDISISTKLIEKILEQMKNEKISEEQK